MKPSLIATAYHEAGHAVIAHQLNFQIEYVTIVPNGEYVGVVKKSKVWWPREITRFSKSFYRGEMQMMVSLAGMVAQTKHNPRSFRKHHISGDGEQIGAFAFKLAGGNTDEAQALIDLANIRVRAMVDRLWPIIEIVAKRLLEEKTLTGEQVKQSFMKYYRDVIDQRRREFEARRTNKLKE